MAWLWMISVGVTDVQFPVWSKDAEGEWTNLRRFTREREGVREVHQGLIAMLNRDQIRFDPEKPDALKNARDLRLDFLQEDGAFVVAIRPEEYRISRWAEIIPNENEERLPLYCPKVEALLPIARETFAIEPATVLVLNTRREAEFREGPEEPIAAGPLVSKCLAERLNLHWIDAEGQLPQVLEPGTATWIDILTGEDVAEDAGVQGAVIRRLSAAIQAWISRADGRRRIVVTTSGGIPALKPIIERVPATAVGQSNVVLLDQPRNAEPVLGALSYDTRVTEREMLRFHCAESLRLGDYASAYGLASRAMNRPWAVAVRDGLGALLEFPGAPLMANGRALVPYALSACRIEVHLCLGDALGALMRLGTFIESLIWELIARDARLGLQQLKVHRDGECLKGDLRPDHSLVVTGMLERNRRGPRRHLVLKLLSKWPTWLSDPDGGQAPMARLLEGLNDRYYPRARPLRNRLLHGTDRPVAPKDAERCLIDDRLILGVGGPFAQNFLSVPDVGSLLTALGATDLAATVGGHLNSLLNRVIEG